MFPCRIKLFIFAGSSFRILSYKCLIVLYYQIRYDKPMTKQKTLRLRFPESIMILKAIYNFLFLFYSIIVCNCCSTFSLVICHISTAIFTPWRKMVFIVVHDTRIRFIYHFLISFHIPRINWRQRCCFLWAVSLLDNSKFNQMLNGIPCLCFAYINFLGNRIVCWKANAIVSCQH